jgi:hypothetical protein
VVSRLFEIIRGKPQLDGESYVTSQFINRLHYSAETVREINLRKQHGQNSLLSAFQKNSVHPSIKLDSSERTFVMECLRTTSIEPSDRRSTE